MGPPGFRGPVSVIKDPFNVMFDQVFQNIKEILNQCLLLTAMIEIIVFTFLSNRGKKNSCCHYLSI